MTPQTMPATDAYLGLRAFADELARCGLEHACTSPGSRSTPLVLSLAREPRIRSSSHIDERCGGFFALGLAKASGRPVALACTSGTAAANYAPAVHEAHEARVPLLVLTADRPPELREVGAGQTIDQIKLYGSAAKWFFEVDDQPATPERMRWLRQLACRAYWTALEGRPGPVHLNFSLREPLVLDAPLPADEPGGGGRGGGRPWVTRPRSPAAAGPALVDGLRAQLDAHPRAVMVAGRGERDPGLGEALAGLAERARAAAARRPAVGRAPRAGRGRSLRRAAARPRLRRRPRARARAALRRPPDLKAAAPVAARPRRAPDRLRRRGRVAGPGGACRHDRHRRPARAGAEATAQGPRLARCLARRGPRGGGRDRGTLERLSEPRVAAELGVRLPAGATLVVASSMPVRDVETFFPARDAPPRVLSNRGANGIDGTVSTAFGVAASGPGPTVLLIGDVALAHDIGGLLAARRLGLPLVIVLLHNDGGGIFHFLPVEREGADFERHVATPHGLDFAHAAALYGLGFERAGDPEAFRAALDRALAAEGATILEVRTERAENVVLHRRVWEAVAESVRGAA